MPSVACASTFFNTSSAIQNYHSLSINCIFVKNIQKTKTITLIWQTGLNVKLDMTK